MKEKPPQVRERELALELESTEKLLFRAQGGPAAEMPTVSTNKAFD